MADTVMVKASCLCGTAKYDISIPKSDLPLKQSFCHCDSDRHMTGTLCLTMIHLSSTFKPADDLISKLTPFAFSPRVTTYFCSTCGSHMLGRCLNDVDDPSKGESWVAMTGSLEHADGIFEAAEHEFIEDTLDGGFSDFLPVVNDKALPRWAGWPRKSEQLPLYWAASTSTQSPASSDKLHAHCKCKGVEFWIARPSERSKNAYSPIADLLVPYYEQAKRDPTTRETSTWWLRENETKFLAGVCSCNSCRLDTGMEWVEWAFVPTVDINLDEEGKTAFELPFGTLKAFRSSPPVVRYHCGVCGASVFFTSEQRDGLVDVAIGLFDAAEGARAESWLDWTTTRLSFREDSIPRAESLTIGVESGLRRFGNRPLP